MTRLLMTASNPSMLAEYSTTFDVDSDEFGYYSDPIDHVRYWRFVNL